MYGCSPLLLRPTQHGIDGVGGETGIADAVGPGGRVDAGLRVQPAVGRLLVFSSGSTNRYRGSYGWIDRRLPASGFGEGGGGLKNLKDKYLCYIQALKPWGIDF